MQPTEHKTNKLVTGAQIAGVVALFAASGIHLTDSHLYRDRYNAERKISADWEKQFHDMSVVSAKFESQLNNCQTNFQFLLENLAGRRQIKP